MIDMRNIVKAFGGHQVLRGLDLKVDRGDICGLAGKSGAGKSTVLRCINGLERFDSGSLVVDGTDVTSLSRNDLMMFRKNIGMVFQHFSLLERLTVYDNIALPLRCWKYQSRHVDAKVRELLEVVGIPEKIRQKPRQLSGGQKQRVAIARALTMDPRILLCDEATSALDPGTAQSILDLLKTINNEMGITIVFVSHQMSVIRRLCKKIAILDNGVVTASGAVKDVFHHQPLALRKLVGDDLTRKNVAMRVLSTGDSTALVSHMAVILGTDVTIHGTNARSDRPGLVISVPADAVRHVEDYLASHRIDWEEAGDQSKLAQVPEPHGEQHRRFEPSPQPEMI